MSRAPPLAARSTTIWRDCPTRAAGFGPWSVARRARPVADCCCALSGGGRWHTRAAPARGRAAPALRRQAGWSQWYDRADLGHGEDLHIIHTEALHVLTMQKSLNS